MIRPLRKAHHRLWLVLLPIAILALAAALLSRSPRPIQTTPPDASEARP